MIRTFVCWNCCGLSIESSKYEEMCPNCSSRMTRRSWSIDEIRELDSDAKIIRGQCQDFVGVGSLRSQEPELLSYAISRNYVQKALEHNVAILFARERDVDGVRDTPMSFVLTEQPECDFFLFHNYLIKETDFYGVSSPSSISSLAFVHPTAYICGLDITIEQGAEIGANVYIKDEVYIREDTRISHGTVIGIPGARLISRLDGTRFQALHGGGVYIGRDVFVGANSVIVKSMWRRPTSIGDNTYIGNLVNIGHNCQIGNNVTVLPGAILCGSVAVGDGATIGPGAIVGNGLSVGQNAIVTMGAVVTKDVGVGETVSGNFAIPHDRLIKHVKDLAI